MSGEIFLVDDNPANLELLSGLLRGHGFKVRMVNDGRRALEMIRARLPELVLLDITMPGLDGYEVCRALKADPATAALPVLFVSALDEPLDKVKAFGAGGVDYVSKPFQAEEVIARVETHLAIGRLRRQLEQRGRELEAALRALEEASRTDPLTGLRNRRFLLQHVEARVAACLDSRAGDAPHALAFLLVDCDHFKQVNDTWGHAVGDAVLVELAARLRRACAEDDVVVRWGGEEFLVVSRVEGDAHAAAERLAERLRSAVSADPFALAGGRPVPCTCSVGFACLPFFPEQPAAASWSETVTVADAALYAAKRAGRNGWVGLRAGEEGKPGALHEFLRAPGAVAAGDLELTTSLDRRAVIAALPGPD
jgi:two-component system sensor histidine kinase ChiS